LELGRIEIRYSEEENGRAHPACHLAAISRNIPPFRPEMGYLISGLIIIAISHIYPRQADRWGGLAMENGEDTIDCV
jgi:hypothetical protein